MSMEAEWDGSINAPEAGLALLLPFIQKEIPAGSALRAYSLLLAAGIRTGNMNTAITKETLALFGAEEVAPQGVYEALEALGTSLGEGPIALPGASWAKVVAVDVHVSEKFGKNLQERYNPMRGRATRSIPTITVADVSSRHADPIMVEVVEDAGERGPPLLLGITPRLKALSPELVLFDGELTSKETVCRLSAKEMGFIGRLSANTLLARRLKPLMVEEGKLYSLRTFDQDWGGAVTVFGFLRGGRHFYYISNLDTPAEDLRKRFSWKWRLENFFRDASFIDEYPGCSQAKARAHAFISTVMGRLTGAFRATAKTMRLLLGAVKRAAAIRGRLVVEFRSLPKRLLEKLRSYVSYLRERLKVDASLQLIPDKAEAGILR